MLLELLFMVLALWVVQRRWQMRRQRALAKLMKSNIKAWPIFGHSYKFMGSGEDRVKALDDFGKSTFEAGGISKIMVFDQLIVCVADPIVAEFLVTECLEKHDIVKTLDFMVFNSSFVSSVPIWRPRRKMMAPIFNSKNLGMFVDIFSRQSKVMVDLMETEVDNGPFSLWDYISAQAFKNVCETTMGTQISDEDTRDVLTALKELWKVTGYVLFRPWYRFKFFHQFLPAHFKPYEQRETVHNFMMKLIREKRQEIEMKTDQKIAEESNDQNKMVSYLGRTLTVPEEKRPTNLELLEECMTIVVAGFDTSASSAAFAALLLSNFPDVQDKVYQELQEVFGDSDRPVVSEDLSHLKYLDMVVKETIRLYPVVTVVARQVEKDVVLPSGMTIVKGCGIMINIWAIHRNPGYWGPDAEQFRPERFRDLKLKHPAAYMPFSCGSRNCIGYRYAMMSMKTVLATMLRRYRLVAAPGVRRGDLLRLNYDFLLKHADDYMIQIQRRK